MLFGSRIFFLMCDVRIREIECTRWFIGHCVDVCVQVVEWFVGGGLVGESASALGDRRVCERSL